MTITDSIIEARKRGVSDDLILKKITEQNPDKATVIETARSRGANSTLIIDEFVHQNPVRSSQVGDKNIFTRIKDTVTEVAKSRTEQLGQVWKKTAEGEITPIETGIQSVGAVAGGLAELAGSALLGAGKAVLPKSVEAGIAKSFQEETAKSDIPELLGKYAKWKQENPRAAANLEGIVDIASILPAPKAAGVAVKGAKEAGMLAKETTKLAGKAAVKTGEVAGATGRFGAAQATGLSPSTIKEIIANPKAFAKEEIEQISRGSLADRVKSSIDDKLEELSITGKEYEVIRKSTDKVAIPEETVEGVLAKYGLQIDESGRIITTAESVPLEVGDVTALERFVAQYGKETELSGNAFLNTRKALSNLSRYDVGKTDISDRIARDLRSTYDELGKTQLKGLAESDARYAPQVAQLNQIKKDYLNPDGTLKDGALNKLANLTGKGKDLTLKRLEEIIPGVSTDIKILKAIEDIEIAGGQKVGTYMRGAGIGFVAGGGSPIGAVLGIILASPSVSVPILRGYGLLKGMTKDAIDKIITKLKSGKKLTRSEGKIFAEAVDHYSNLS